LALLLLYDRASPVVRIHHLVADLEQPTPLSMPVVAKTPAGKMAAGEGSSVPDLAQKSQVSRAFNPVLTQNPCSEAPTRRRRRRRAGPRGGRSRPRRAQAFRARGCPSAPARSRIRAWRIPRDAARPG